MKARVTGIGWVTPAGKGTGRSAAPFAPAPGKVVPLTRRDVFDQPDQRFGRLDPFSRLGLAAIAFALRDAGLEAWREKRPLGVVAASLLGCLATDVDYFRTVLPQGGAFASPHLFAYTLPNVFLGEAAIRFGLTGPTFVLNPTADDGLDALRLALETLAWGEAPAMLAGTVDLPPPDGFPTGGLSCPGALFVVLENQPRAPGTDFGSISLAADGSLVRGRRAVTSLAGLVIDLRQGSPSRRRRPPSQAHEDTP